MASKSASKFTSSARRNRPDPLPVVVLGRLAVDRRHQGQSYAASVMADLEERARSKANCVALKLWVRSTKARAIGFYTKVGFVTDPAGPFQQDIGDSMLTMRKFLR
jgi:GNAT superfamily N-acetyltransferase